MKKICPVCHNVFETKGNYHIYCSTRCRKLHHKLTYYSKDKKSPVFHPGDKVLRRFYCGKCQKLVLVTSETDKRIKFCSPYCEKLYWKHPRKDIKSETEIKTDLQ